MAIKSKEIGQSAEYYMLYEILKQLDKLTKVIGASITTSTTTTAP